MNFKSLILGLALVGCIAPIMPMETKKEEEKKEKTYFERCKQFVNEHKKWFISGAVGAIGLGLAYCYRDVVKSHTNAACRYFESFFKPVTNTLTNEQYKDMMRDAYENVENHDWHKRSREVESLLHKNRSDLFPWLRPMGKTLRDIKMHLELAKMRKRLGVIT